MKRSLSKFMDRLEQQSEHLRSNANKVDLITEEEASSVRGGDKEYKPIYENLDDQAHQWKKPSILFNFFDSI